MGGGLLGARGQGLAPHEQRRLELDLGPIEFSRPRLPGQAEDLSRRRLRQPAGVGGRTAGVDPQHAHVGVGVGPGVDGVGQAQSFARFLEQA